MSYLVFGSWGCFEVECDSVQGWFASVSEASERRRALFADYKFRASEEAETAANSLNSDLTSDYYAFVAMVEVRIEHSGDERSMARDAVAALGVEDGEFALRDESIDAWVTGGGGDIASYAAEHIARHLGYLAASYAD